LSKKIFPLSHEGSVKKGGNRSKSQIGIRESGGRIPAGIENIGHPFCEKVLMGKPGGSHGKKEAMKDEKRGRKEEIPAAPVFVNSDFHDRATQRNANIIARLGEKSSSNDDEQT